MKNTFIVAMFIFWGFVVAVISAGYIVKQNRLVQESMQKTYIESVQQITEALAKGKNNSIVFSQKNILPTSKTIAPNQVVTKPLSTGNPSSIPTLKPAGLTMDVVAQHNTQSDCWIVINGNVYSVASYIPMHPGGARRIINECGADATGQYDRQGHSSYADSLLGSYLVGPLQ